mgnify:CR=1 FL=1
MTSKRDRAIVVSALKHAAPYIRLFKGKVFVLKAGGEISSFTIERRFLGLDTPRYLSVTGCMVNPAMVPRESRKKVTEFPPAANPSRKVGTRFRRPVFRWVKNRRPSSRRASYSTPSSWLQ